VSGKKVTARHRIEYALARGGISLLGFLPERLGYAGMALLARVWIACVPSRRRLGRQHLELAYPGRFPRREANRVLARSTANAFQNVLDMLHAARHLERGTIRERIDLGDAPATLIDPPFLGVSLHLGSWEVGALAMASLKGEAHAIGRVPKNPLIARYLRRCRERIGLVLHDRRGGIRPTARALAEGKVGLQVVDQNQRKRGVFAPMFGRIASCERAAATLAVRRGYPIVPGVAFRVGGGFRFRLVLLEPFVPARGGDPEQDVYEAVVAINQRAEQFVRMEPEQYLWVHDRYRTRPPGESEASGGA
jgi:KDO2-lipid IV(A) lauroyltransferase